MPELPEVETVMRGLAPVMQGVRIARAQVNRPDLRWPFPPHMEARLTGARIEMMRRRSKYILAGLDSGETLLIHLGMSGRMVINPEADQKHDHVVLEMETGARIVFNDPRRFGAMDLCDTATLDQHRLIAVLGPEPLGNRFDAAYLETAFKGRKMPVKSALLDQRIIAGLGNIYVCEVLWRAGIHPQTAIGTLAPHRMPVLVRHIREVLTEAIEAGGSSLRDYVQTNGDLGYFQHRFAVYGREGNPCATPGCAGTIARMVQSGRSTFYCPTCQQKA